jgi:hypothetical protein
MAFEPQQRVWVNDSGQGKLLCIFTEPFAAAALPAILVRYLATMHACARLLANHAGFCCVWLGRILATDPRDSP